ASLGGTDGDVAYEEARDAAIDEYFSGGPRPSNIILPFSAEVENRIADDPGPSIAAPDIDEGPLPVGSDA
ncbi:MAG: hypothetical protein ABEK12_00905, partial [Candidatus Nanohaloarchaea archaeon]